jgi:mannose/fructose/N-acetylgalactosamine-specific phosphotransferase system component IIC
MVGAPLELFWLGAVNLGAALPVHEALGTCAVAAGAILAGQAMGHAATPATAALALLVCGPLALLGRAADRYVETDFNERLAARADRLCEAGRLDAAARSSLLGLALPFAIAALLAPLGAAATRVLAPALLRAAPGAVPVLGVGWLCFSGLACAAGAKALRARHAPAAFLAAFAAVTTAGAAMLWLRVRP